MLGTFAQLRSALCDLLAMETQRREAFNAKEKLDILRKAKVYLCRILMPSAIVPHLTPIIDRDLQRRILEVEDSGRKEEAMKLVIDRVLEEGEAGLNHFLHALRGDDSVWPLALEHLADNNSSSSGGSAEDMNRSSNQYYAFILHLLQGQIIDSLTDATLQHILPHLLSHGAIEEYEEELITAKLRAKGRHAAALSMFTLLGVRTDDWPLAFFRALQAECPVLLDKIGLFGVDPVVEKGDSEGAIPDADASGRERSALEECQEEQTHPKQLLMAGQDEQGFVVSQAVLSQAERGHNLSDKEKRRTRRARHEITNLADSSSDDEDDDRPRARVLDVNSENCPHGFSDDEKQDNEEPEKKEGEPPAGGAEERRAKDLALRAYQRELAQNAVRGVNTIICAPTGSGKTRVAIHIVQQHFQEAHAGTPRKVVFLARTVPLVFQQYRNFKDYLPQYTCELVTGESAHSMSVHHIMEERDILVLTPKILENHLGPDKIPSLAAFSLLIFDECHHTRKGEPYNSVMKHYLQSQARGETGLPQIVGLTASIGVEKASTPEEAKESILSIMANLDVEVNSEVLDPVNKEELLRLVPRPEEDLMALSPREMDDVSNAMKDKMLKIVEELNVREEHVKGDKAVDELRTILHKKETDLRSQKFAQWAVLLKMEAKLMRYPKEPKDEAERLQMHKRQLFGGQVQVLAEWLVAYNEAFDIHDLTQPEDVLNYLESKSQLLREEGKEFISTELEEKLTGYFTDVQRELKRFRKRPNPNLDHLGRIIVQHIDTAPEGDEDGFRILVYVRTRATCLALCRWLNDPDTDQRLRDLKAKHFTGTGASLDVGGMTPHDQIKTLKKFQKGDCKLLTTTSVGEEGIDIAECNLTIRYNQIGNEVTTVQTRGRSRKRGGRSILMAMPKIIEREELNRKREELMNAGLSLIRAMTSREIKSFIKKVQEKTLDVEQIEQIMRQVKDIKMEADFSVNCPKCGRVKVNGAKIRRINNAHHVIIGHDIDDRVIKKPGKSFLVKDDWEMQGSVHCTCKAKLGQLLLYKKARFIIVSPKYWVFVDKNNEPSSYKQWVKVPWDVAAFTSEDLKEHMGIQSSSAASADDGDVTE